MAPVDAGGRTGPEPGAGRGFSAVLRRGPAAAVVVLAGELDQDTAQPLRTALADALSDGTPRIVVDCARLAFCDSTGLNILLKARAAALEAGGRVELAALRPPVDRIFAVTGARDLFTVHPELPPGLAGEEP
ncbi:STAS domain-containing protein [Streptomyces bambusae]|uniref:STAS domain-containing protein n=1 Tax=Streptomyces bambusae TaxID=1550616 RepID=UPI001CFF1F9F|nr:STAS domain-containing protein [Streptomyces bambusae]MCB5164240.1 STAS domain-containing protein [Streptomyces bambusae]